MRYARVAWLLILGIGFGAVSQAGAQQSADPFDLLILGGRVIDGTGNPWFYADVGIRGSRVAAVGVLSTATAVRTIDATGKYVVPGFIDLHSHAGDSGQRRGLTDDDPGYRAAPNLVVQGLTTLVANQDGTSHWPIRDQRVKMESQGIGPNTVLLIGHGTLRAEVMGEDYRREATREEIRRMQALLRQGMEEGAYGLSAGHEYVPMRWSSTDEIIALVREVKPWNGVYIVHERSSGSKPMWWWPSADDTAQPTMLDAVLETIRVAEQTGVTSVQTHIKARGVDFWGTSEAIVRQIERARARGVPVWADQYPYNTTGSDGNMVMISPRVLEKAQASAVSGGPPDYAAALRELLADSAAATRVRQDVEYEILRRGGAENILILEHPDEALVGKTVEEAARERDITPVEMAIELQLNGDRRRPGGARVRGFSLSEFDVENFMKQPWLATSTDAGVALPGDGPVHPRYYGTYPRKIHEYVQERGVIDLEFAIRSMTSLPAQILGLRDRGQIREGFEADVVVFDPRRIEDRATAMDPYRQPHGVDYVLVNGTFVVENGEVTGALPGKVITPADRASPQAAPAF